RRRRGVHDHGGSGARGANAYGIHPMLKRIPPDAVAHDAAIDWVARAREVAPLLTEAADRMERDRALTPEVLAALYDRELFRMVRPRACGGAEAPPAVFVETVEEVARADASTAWCIGQACGGSMAAGYLAADVARDIFADRHAVVASGPTHGTAVAV